MHAQRIKLPAEGAELQKEVHAHEYLREAILDTPVQNGVVEQAIVCEVRHAIPAKTLGLTELAVPKAAEQLVYQAPVSTLAVNRVPSCASTPNPTAKLPRRCGWFGSIPPAHGPRAPK